MPKVPYSPLSPIGDAFNNLGNSLIEAQAARGNTERNMALSQSRQQLTDAQRRKVMFELGDLQQERKGRSDIAGLFGAETFDPRAATVAAAGSGFDPKDLANLNLFYQSMTGADNPTLHRAFTGAGKGLGLNQALTQERQSELIDTNAQNDLNKALAVQGASDAGAMARYTTPKPGDDPTALFDQYFSLATNKGGMTPEQATPWALSQAAKRGAGMSLQVDPEGGVSFSQGGMGGGFDKPMTRDLQQRSMAMVDFNDTMNQLEAVANDPTNFGLAGQGKRLGQMAGQQVDQLSALFGEDLNTEFQQAEQALLPFGIEFDPNISALDRLATIAAYKGAAAVADQSGRELSDKDFRAFRNIIGDPNTFFSSQRDFQEGMRTLRQQVNIRAGRLQDAQRGGPAAVDEALTGVREGATPAPAGGQSEVPPAQPGAAVPGNLDFSGMSFDDLMALDRSKMTPEQLRAAAERFKTIGGM